MKSIKKFFSVSLFLSLFISFFSFADAQKNPEEENYQTMINAYNKGDSSKSFDIALAFKNGWNGAPRDISKAIYWLDKAFDAGYPRAAVLAGTIYRTGDGIKMDLPKAEKYYRKAASKDNEDAMIRLGQMYYYGTGVKSSYATAKKWYWAGAKKYEGTNKSCSLSCKLYADMCFYTTLREEDHKADYASALKWYEKAFNAGYMEASVNLASLTYKKWTGANNKPDANKAIKILTAASYKGYQPAMQELVNVYYSGKYGKKDMVNAYAWAAVLAARNDNVINSQAVMQQAEKEMSAAEKKKAKKTAELLIKKIGSNSYYGSISTID